MDKITELCSQLAAVEAALEKGTNCRELLGSAPL